MPALSTRLLSVTVILLLGVWGALPGHRAVPRDASAAAAEFSAGRAIAHVREIAKRPHPIGSAEHARVANYVIGAIRKLGLEPRLQQSTGMLRYGDLFGSGFVTNIAARLRGTANTRALMLVGHYDSVRTGPGAADDGHAVGVLLETMRALRSGPPLRNDVIFLFTDGEESGMLGAEAFVREHPWRRDAALVVNFEARGTGGAPAMFETSEGNGRLIQQLAEASPYANANSIAFEIYRRMPNNTDLTVFKRAGMAGLNLAFMEHPEFYHSPFDDVAHLDSASVQEQGDYALALARRFGRDDLSDMRAADAVYFRTKVTPLLLYPAAWASFLCGATLLVILATVWTGLQRGAIKWRGILLGLLAFPLCAIAAALLQVALWRLAVRVYPQYASFPLGFGYNEGWYAAAGMAMAVGVFVAVFILFAQRSRAFDLIGAALLEIGIIAFLLSFPAPGATFVLQWPALFGALTLLIAVTAPSPFAPGWRLALVLLFVFPAFALLEPFLPQMFIALGMRGMPVVAVMVSLLMALVGVPVALSLGGCGKSKFAGQRPTPTDPQTVDPVLWSRRFRLHWIPAGCLAAAVAFWILADAHSGFDATHPQPSQIAWALDADHDKAYWISAHGRNTWWTAQFLGPSPRLAQTPFYPLHGRPVLQSPALVLPIPAPEVKVVSDVPAGSGRDVILRVSPGRPSLSIFLIPLDARITHARLNGIAWPDPIRQGSRAADPFLSIDALPESGATLELAFDRPARQLRVVSISHGVPAELTRSVRPRPADTFEGADYGFIYDSTIVLKTFDLSPGTPIAQ